MKPRWVRHSTCPESLVKTLNAPRKDWLKEVPEGLMKALTYDNETLANKCIRLVRLVFISLLITGAVIAFCSSRGLAQSSIVADSPQAEVTATRQRRLRSEASSKDRTTAASAERPMGSHTERRVFVRSKSLLVGAAVVEEKLLKRPEFRQLGFVLTRDESEADLILELRHDLFTMYVFSVVDANTGVVLLGGKLSSLGGTVAGKVARRFVKEMPSVGP
jgi:hypothetical protein